MAQTPTRVNITIPAQLLLEVAGSGTQQKIADIELPVVVLVGAGVPPTIQVAPIQDTPLDVVGHIVRGDGSLGAPVTQQEDGTYAPAKEYGVLGHEPESPVGWSTPGKAGQCPNTRPHGRHTWGQIEGTPTVEQILGREVKVTHYHCDGA